MKRVFLITWLFAANSKQNNKTPAGSFFFFTIYSVDMSFLFFPSQHMRLVACFCELVRAPFRLFTEHLHSLRRIMLRRQAELRRVQTGGERKKGSLWRRLRLQSCILNLDGTSEARGAAVLPFNGFLRSYNRIQKEHSLQSQTKHSSPCSEA